jgi:L-asparaginase II
MSSNNTNPVLVNVYRNRVIESCHRGSAIAVNSKGETVFAIGDTDREIYARSSLKLLQAIPLLESGAADKFEMSDAEIALACASHSAEPMHTDTVLSWLDRLGLGTDDLECGAVWPDSDKTKHQMVASGKSPTRVHQTCSGKHSGMLTLARYLGVGTTGYSGHEHPTQKAWMNTLSELIDVDVAAQHWERDGCGMPAVCLSMERVAFGCALFADPHVIGGSRGQAMSRIVSAVQAHPGMIAGTGRCCTDVIQETNGTVLVKTGAEGVYAGVLTELGLGLTLKIDDGATRGSEVALGALLRKLGAIDSRLYEQLGNYFEPEVLNSQHRVTGKITASSAWKN